MAYTGAVPSFTDGLNVEDNDLNELVDAVNAFGGTTLDTFTPTLTASGGNPTLGSGATQTGYYTRVGDRVDFSLAVWVATSGYSAGTGTYEIALPVTASSSVPFVYAASVSLGGTWATPYTAITATGQSGTSKLRLYAAGAALSGATLTANSTIMVSGFFWAA